MSAHPNIKDKLRDLMALPYETEWVEFKEAKNNYDFDDLGKYFSALSNASNLNGQLVGWLIFGVTNKPPRQIVGTITVISNRAWKSSRMKSLSTQTIT